MNKKWLYYIALITNTNLIQTIVNKAQSIWKILKAQSKGHDYVYVTDTPIENIYQWTPTIRFVEGKNDSNANREFKRLTAAKYFLENTDADFLVVPTDDLIVDAERIDELAEELGEKYDTNKNVIILGNCLYHGFKYLQGGPGYIFTRVSAKAFVDFGPTWVLNSTGADDVAIVKFVNHIGKDASDAAVDYMAGHGLNQLTRRNVDLNRFPKCRNFYEPQCKQGYHPFNRTYMIHTSQFPAALYVWEN